jgi:hypothetical protein
MKSTFGFGWLSLADTVVNRLHSNAVITTSRYRLLMNTSTRNTWDSYSLTRVLGTMELVPTLLLVVTIAAWCQEDRGNTSWTFGGEPLL